jgi:hypothetical protein
MIFMEAMAERSFRAVLFVIWDVAPTRLDNEFLLRYPCYDLSWNA